MIVFASLYFYFFAMSGDIAARIDVLAQVEKEIIEIVQDDNRETRAIDVIEQMKVVVQKQQDEYTVIQSDYLKISADYNADIQQYSELDKKVDDFWHNTMQQQIDLRFALREQLSREEWKKLYKEIN